MLTTYLICRPLLPKPICFEIIIMAFPLRSLYGAIIRAPRSYLVKKIVFSQNINPEYALNYVGISGNVELFNELVGETTEKMGDVLFGACENNNLNLIREILKKFKVDSNLMFSLIYLSIINDNFNVFELLINEEDLILCENFNNKAYFAEMATILEREKFIEHYGDILGQIVWENMESHICESPKITNFESTQFIKWGIFKGSIKVIDRMRIFEFDDFSIINQAIDANQLNLIKHMILHYSYIIKQYNIERAIQLNRIEIVEYFLDFNLDFNAAIQVALKFGRFALADLINLKKN